MANSSLDAVVRHLRQIAAPAADPREDRELLDAFATRQDQAAFAVLVRRHGSLVLNVCRRVLRHEQDAEDAFQAAFLVLATKAASLSIKTSVAGFLHGVAYRLALKARRDAVRRRRREARAPASPALNAAAEPGWREVQAVLEEEIQRLPQKYRLPFVLCHLQGLSRAEAGRQLGLKEGTVWSRLAQARSRLQERLGRRGIVLSAALAAAAVSEVSVQAAMVAAVVQGTRQSAAGLLTGAVSARVALLAQTGLQTMTVKIGLALVGLATLLMTAGAIGVIGQLLKEKPAAPPQAKAAVESKKPAAPRMRRDRYGDPLPDGAIARLGTVRWRHGWLIYDLAYSPDGKRIAAVGLGRAITLWDAATGKEVRQFPNDGQAIRLAFSPDGKILATTGRPSACRLWDVATGKELRQLKAPTKDVTSIVFSPDGKRVATVNFDGTLRLWDPATGSEQRRLDCEQGELYTVAFSPDGKLLASGGKDGAIRLWDSRTGEGRRRLKGHEKEIKKVAFSPDGKQLASTSQDETIRLWDTATGRQVRVLGEKLGEYGLPITFSPDGKLLASGHQDGMVRLWDPSAGTETRRWRVGAASVQAIAFSPDGKTLATGTVWGGGIRLWDAATGKERHPSDEHHGLVDFLRFSPDGATLISIGRDKRLLRWDLATNTPRQQFSWTTKRYSGFALSPDGNTLAANGWPDAHLRLWDVRTGKPGRALGKPREEIFWPIAFSSDGRLVASEDDDHVIHVWDVRDGKEVRRIKEVKQKVQCLRFSPDSTALACGLETQGNASGEPTLRLWNMADGKERCSFNSHVSVNGTLAFSPDGKTLAVGHGDHRESAVVRLWDAATGQELRRHEGHQEGIGALAFSPDSKLVTSGAGSIGRKDNSVHVWEAVTGCLIRQFEGHHSCVGSVAFSPDGLTVASGAGDSTILLWDITGRRPDGRWHAKPLTPRELDAYWTALANEDAAKAYDAVWALVRSAEQAVPFLAKHLRPMPRPDAKVVLRLIADLDSDRFTVRQRAMKDLGKFGDAVAPTLQRTLEGKPALEMRRRVQQLLDQTRDWNAERLRDHRAIQVLEHIGTRQAKEMLEALASGASEAYRTEAAREALQRLSR